MVISGEGEKVGAPVGRLLGPPWYRTLVKDWLSWQRRRNRAPNSLQAWAWGLRDFGRQLDADGVLQIEQLTRENLRRWQDRISVRVKPTSHQVAVGAVRGLLKWADREELGVRPGLWGWLDSPKIPEALPRALEEDVIRKALRYYSGRPARGASALTWHRDRALFAFLLTSGLRISEALQLDRDQVADGHRVVVRQKGGGEHLVVVSSRTSAWLRDYLRIRGRDDQPALWTRLGRGGRRLRLDDEDANDVWRALAERLQLPQFTNHVLRHTAATELLEHGGTELDAARHLGHRGLATIQRYAKVRDARRRELVDRMDDLFPEDRPAVLKPISRRRRPPARPA